MTTLLSDSLGNSPLHFVYRYENQNNVAKSDDMLRRFDTVHECNIQTAERQQHSTSLA